MNPSHRRGNKDGSDRDNGDYLVIEEESGDPNKRFVVINPLEVRRETQQRARGATGVPLWGLGFGPKGETRLLVWAQSKTEAFDRATDWMSGRIPGIVVTRKERGRLIDEVVGDWGVVYDGSKGSSRDDLYRVTERASEQEFLEEYGE